MDAKNPRPSTEDLEFMRSLEAEFKQHSGLTDRSQFKIFYGPVWDAPIVILGINPAGDPDIIAPDGVHYLDGRAMKASSSIGYYENGENDLVDCTWRETKGLLKLLKPILEPNETARRSVVKTNLAFVRLPNVKGRYSASIERSKAESALFLSRILSRISPELILLAGVKLYDFTSRHCVEVHEIGPRVEVRSVYQTVIFPAHVQLLSGQRCVAVEVAHASQFSWIYMKHDVATQIKALREDQRSQA